MYLIRGVYGLELLQLSSPRSSCCWKPLQMDLIGASAVSGGDDALRGDRRYRGGILGHASTASLFPS